jgi:hypothetical protein
MEQSRSWEANCRSTSQEIPHLLWNPKIHYPFRKSTPLIPILSQISQVHTLPPCLRSISVSSFHLRLGLPNVILTCVSSSVNGTFKISSCKFITCQDSRAFPFLPHLSLYTTFSLPYCPTTLLQLSWKPTFKRPVILKSEQQCHCLLTPLLMAEAPLIRTVMMASEQWEYWEQTQITVTESHGPKKSSSTLWRDFSVTATQWTY